MRKIALLLCAALLLGLFTGCASEEAYVPTGNALDGAELPTQATSETVLSPYQQEVKSYTLAYYPDAGFNPYLCDNLTNRMLFSLLYQGLFTVDRYYNVEPMLCKSYTVSEDMTRYTFYLDAATFSDGNILRAGDVVASLQAAQESLIYGGRFEHIVSIESLSADSVTITTDCAYENLPLLLDVPILRGAQVGDSMPVGTGPYYLVHNSGTMALQRRNDWWCQADLAVQSNSIVLWEATNPVGIRDHFEFEDLGLSYADPGSANYADYRSDYEVWDCETGIMLYLGCNSTRGVFSDPEVRAALTYAIDRETILEDCYKGFGQAATLPASPNSPYYDKGLAGQVKYDPVRLRTALDESTLSGSTVTLLVNKADTVRLQAARLISDMLTQCGLVVKIQDMSAKDYEQSLRDGKFDLYLGQTRLSANMDLSEFFLEKGYLRFGGMSNGSCYTMCLEALENSGNYYNLHQLVLKNGQLTPILFRTYAVYMERGLLEGLSPARDNVFWYSIGKTLEDALAVSEETIPEGTTEDTQDVP